MDFFVYSSYNITERLSLARYDNIASNTEAEEKLNMKDGNLY
jgi:hypothetical protein